MTDHVEILQGDCRETLKTIPDKTVHCTVSSPPYWGLRAYIDDEREIGREPTPEAHIANLVDVFREVRRTLRDDGTLWLNYGDSYSGSWGNSGKRPELDDGAGGQRPKGAEYFNRPGWDERRERPPASRKQIGYKPKDLLSMPFRVVEALRMDGWYHRSTIIWSKKSPMPESVGGTKFVRCRVKVASEGHGGNHRAVSSFKDERTDAGMALSAEGRTTWQPCPGCEKCGPNGGYVLRMNAGRPTTSHEFVFLLTKSASYFYNQDGNRLALSENPVSEARRGRSDKGLVGHMAGHGDWGQSGNGGYEPPAGRNLWTVWNDIKQSSYKGAHFATMALDLALRCVKLGTSDAGCCPTCGNQHAPVVETEVNKVRPAENGAVAKECRKIGEQVGTNSLRDGFRETATSIKEWRATCTCPNNSGGKPTVLDPFHGSGTTGEAARECGCNYIGCELSEEYIELSRKRFDQEVLF